MLVSSLLEADLPVYPVNPKTVDRDRKASGAKTDAIDAYLLARTGRSDLADLRRLEPPAALELFRQLRQPSSLAFLESYPTPEAALGSTSRRSPPSWKRHGHPRPNQTAEHIMRKLREPHLKADAITTRTKARLMLALVSIWVRVVHAMWPRHEPYDASTRPDPVAELPPREPWAGIRAEDASLPPRVPGNPGPTAEVARRFSLFVVSVVSLASRNWPPIKTGPG